MLFNKFKHFYKVNTVLTLRSVILGLTKKPTFCNPKLYIKIHLKKKTYYYNHRLEA